MATKTYPNPFPYIVSINSCRFVAKFKPTTWPSSALIEHQIRTIFFITKYKLVTNKHRSLPKLKSWPGNNYLFTK